MQCSAVVVSISAPGMKRGSRQHCCKALLSTEGPEPVGIQATFYLTPDDLGLILASVNGKLRTICIGSARRDGGQDKNRSTSHQTKNGCEGEVLFVQEGSR